jgi:hypothetical protein
VTSCCIGEVFFFFFFQFEEGLDLGLGLGYLMLVGLRTCKLP